jgi:glycosyltransferase involved in cell wall biosynthesis
MRILFLLTQDLESPGGLGRYFPLAKGLAGRGHQVTIAALHANFSALRQSCLKMDGVEVRYVAQMHVKKMGNLKIYYSQRQLAGIIANATWRLAQAAWQIPADIVHIGKPHPMNGLAGLIARRLPGRKSLFVDCDDDETAQGHFTGRWQRSGMAFFENMLPRLADGVTTNTAFTRQRLLNLGIPSERIYYLSNGIDRARFSGADPARVAQLRAQLGLEGKSVVAFIGSLSRPSHPVDLLVEAFARVHQSIPNTALLIVGGGDEYHALSCQVREAGLSDSVVFTGRVTPDLVPLYYRLANVSVDPVADDDIARGRQPLTVFPGIPATGASWPGIRPRHCWPAQATQPPWPKLSGRCS